MKSAIHQQPEFLLDREQQPPKASGRVLEPVDRISEIWFGLIMVLTFTCSISVTESGLKEVHTVLIAAIGCNLAWGIIDAFMYLLACFVQQGRGLAMLRAVRQATDADTAHRLIADTMPPLLASLVSCQELGQLRQRLNQLQNPPAHPKLTKKDWLGALAIFLAVFVSTFPVVIPFLIVANPVRALRISNGVAVIILFLVGYAFGHHAGYRPWRMGLWMAILGSGLVVLTIALGG